MSAHSDAVGTALTAAKSLSMMVTVAVAGAPSVAPVAPLSCTVNAWFPSTSGSSMIGTSNDFGALSPSAQISGPAVVV